VGLMDGFVWKGGERSKGATEGGLSVCVCACMGPALKRKQRNTHAMPTDSCYIHKTACALSSVSAPSVIVIPIHHTVH
jgi:hypothetical protein